ncbi:MAG: ImmA/IrrE family metallo-endopeptidase [Bacteroidota bacterium]|nr:ImmA/IrrE family metallo-endopeptidase [Bacteroidota bacterium]
MMLQEQKINPKMLMLAREARGLTQLELADQAGINRSNISRFEQEFTGFTDDVLEKLIRALRFPENFFLQDQEILPPALYRRRDKVPSKALSFIDANINIYRLNLQRLMEAMKIETHKIPLLPVSEIGSPAEAAIKLRKLWKMPKGEINNLIEILEANGVMTLAVDFGTDRVDSRSVLINNEYPIIFYNKTLLGDRLRFSLAYELGHIIMHTRQVLVSLEELGHEANLFAAEFLMPAKDIHSDLKETINLDVLMNLKRKWKVSMQALLYRASDLELLSENQKRYIIGQFNALKIRRREPVELDVMIERGSIIRDLITRYRNKQKMSVKEMAEFFYLSQEEFLQRYN